MNLLVVGAGTMGRWFAASIADPDSEFAFADTDFDVATAAADALDGRAVSLDTDDRFDGVCLAVPISTVETAVAEHAPKAERAIIDVTGDMTAPIEAMGTHAANRERLSLHPLFAPENAPGRVAVVADATGPVTDTVRERLAERNTLFETTPEEHARAMRTVQVRAHAAVMAYALAGEAVPEAFETPISGPLDSLAEQVLSGSPEIYAEIQDTFEGAKAVATAAERIAEADKAEFETLYREARDAMDGR